MRTTFDKLGKGLFLKVYRYTIVYYIIFNCGSLTRFSLILEDLYRRSRDMLWTAYTGASLILEKLFSMSSFYYITCLWQSWWTAFGCYHYFREYFPKFQYWCYYILWWTIHMKASIVLEDSFRSSRTPPII